MKAFTSSGKLFDGLQQSMQRFNSTNRNVEQEDLCRKCGECCREKIVDNGHVIPTDIFCPALDPETKRCRIYQKRLTLLKELTGRPCLTITEAIKTGTAPTNCAYASIAYQGIRYDPGALAERLIDAYTELQKRVAGDREKIDGRLKKVT